MKNNDKVIIHDQQWTHELEKGVEEYTDMLFEALWGDENDEITDTLTGELFCGCADCFWREALTYLVPRILKGAQEGKIELEE